MAIVYDTATLDRYMTHAVDASPEHPVLVDKFLEDAFEFDVDAVADRTGAVIIGGIMEHIEEAGIHSGDSSCVVPPFICPERHLQTIRDHTRRIAKALGVIGLMNVQFAIKDDVVYVLEVNPRASRTVPYLSKATGTSLAKLAAKVMAGRTLAELGHTQDLEVAGVFVKSPVFPFVRFPGVDTILGPEMKSTGEVMGGSSSNFGVAFAKAQLSVGQRLPERRDGVRQREQRRQGEPDADCARPRGAGLPPHRHARHRGVSARVRPRGRRGLQGQRRPAEHRRRDREPQGRSRHQHAARPRVVLRRSDGPPRRDDARSARASRRSPARPPPCRPFADCARKASASARCRTTTQELPRRRSESRAVSAIHRRYSITKTRRTRRSLV